MRRRLICHEWILLGIMLGSIASCQGEKSNCQWPEGTPLPLTIPPTELSTPTPGASQAPIAVQIGGREILVDKVVSGPLCNDSWTGTVYVSCDVQVYAYADQPTFLEDCDLEIEPNTVVYVAYHNDTAYYQGCSCHTGEIAQP